MPIKLCPADFKTDFAALKSIRETVFVHEQSVPVELEWDEYDRDAYHLLAFDDGKPVATARLLASGKIGRIAVLRNWRHQGIGTALVQSLLVQARESGLDQVYLSAQVTAISFYERLGFVVSSDIYEDAGIPHRDMQLRLAASK